MRMAVSVPSIVTSGVLVAAQRTDFGLSPAAFLLVVAAFDRLHHPRAAHVHQQVPPPGEGVLFFAGGYRPPGHGAIPSRASAIIASGVVPYTAATVTMSYMPLFKAAMCWAADHSG